MPGLTSLRRAQVGVGRAAPPIAFGLVAAAVLASCSGGASGSAGTSGSSKAAKASSHSSPSCALVGAAQVQSTLGIAVNAPTPTVNGPVTVCTYTGTGPAPSTVIVRFATGSTTSTFQAAKAQFAAHQEPTADLAGLGDAAYTSTLGAGTVVQNTVVVLKGSTELLVSAPAQLSQVEALARQVLSSL